MEFEFDDSEAGDIRRWLDVVSHQLYLLKEQLEDPRNTEELTAEGVTVVSALLEAFYSLRRGVMIDDGRVRGLLDILMSSRSSIMRPRWTSLEPARPQERANHTISDRVDDGGIQQRHTPAGTLRPKKRRRGRGTYVCPPRHVDAIPRPLNSRSLTVVTCLIQGLLALVLGVYPAARLGILPAWQPFEDWLATVRGEW